MQSQNIDKSRKQMSLITHIRKYLKLSQANVAKENGLSLEYLEKIENESTPIPHVLINYYANGLKVKKEYLEAIIFSKLYVAKFCRMFLIKYFAFVNKNIAFKKDCC